MAAGSLALKGRAGGDTICFEHSLRTTLRPMFHTHARRTCIQLQVDPLDHPVEDRRVHRLGQCVPGLPGLVHSEQLGHDLGRGHDALLRQRHAQLDLVQAEEATGFVEGPVVLHLGEGGRRAEMCERCHAVVSL